MVLCDIGPRVGLTGYGTEEDFRRSRAAGFTAHLTKPVSVQELHRLLESLAGPPEGQAPGGQAPGAAPPVQGPTATVW